MTDEIQSHRRFLESFAVDSCSNACSYREFIQREFIVEAVEWKVSIDVAKVELRPETRSILMRKRSWFSLLVGQLSERLEVKRTHIRDSGADRED